MKYYKFNMNNVVKVKLNDYGREILRKHHENIVRQLPQYKKEYVEKPVDSDGYSSFQMHTFMNIFGGYMNVGSELPFENCSIKIAGVLLKEDIK